MLGAHLLYDLTRSGVKVRALKRNESELATAGKIFSWYAPDAGRLFSQIEWFEGDLLDKFSLEKGLEGVEAVVHSAAKVSFDPRDTALMLHENAEGTANLVDLAVALKIRHFCHVSSVAALGVQELGWPVNEDFSWKNDRQRSAYSESKFLAEMEVWRGVQEGLEAVIVNPSIILGPGNWRSGSPSFFQTIGKGMKFYPPGGTGFVDVRDVSKAIISLLQAKDWDAVKNQRFILSADNLSYREIFERIAVALNRPKPSFRANKFLLEMGWRVSWLVSHLTGRRPALTMDTARSSVKVTAYDGSKISRVTGLEYTPIDKTIRDIGKIYLSER